jgi:ribosomal protein S18 acetylase RimI-like enzyme
MTSELVAVRSLSAEQRAAAEALRIACEAHDGCELPIELDEDRVPGGGQAGHFLYLETGQVLGYLGIGPDAVPEALPLVYPAARRSGIGRRLVKAARAEARLRGCEALLLVVPGASPAGAAFVAALPAEHELTEHRMELDRSLSSPAPPPAPGFLLKQVGTEELDTLSRICSLAFGKEEPTQRGRFAEWLRMPNQRLFIGYQASQPVGSVRVGDYDGVIYLHTFGVLPEHQGQGIGGRILREVIDLLTAEGRGPIRLEVDVQNPSALALYHRRGFRTLDSFHYYRIAV